MALGPVHRRAALDAAEHPPHGIRGQGWPAELSALPRARASRRSPGHRCAHCEMPRNRRRLGSGVSRRQTRWNALDRGQGTRCLRCRGTSHRAHRRQSRHHGPQGARRARAVPRARARSPHHEPAERCRRTGFPGGSREGYRAGFCGALQGAHSCAQPNAAAAQQGELEWRRFGKHRRVDAGAVRHASQIDRQGARGPPPAEGGGNHQSGSERAWNQRREVWSSVDRHRQGRIELEHVGHRRGAGGPAADVGGKGRADGQAPTAERLRLTGDRRVSDDAARGDRLPHVPCGRRSVDHRSAGAMGHLGWQRIRRARGVTIHGADAQIPSATSSAQTRKPSSLLGPNVVTMATSAASLPLAIKNRPMRRVLLRGSNVCHAPPRYASNHAAKSPGG